jgi:hypothetical protein
LFVAEVHLQFESVIVIDDGLDDSVLNFAVV